MEHALRWHSRCGAGDEVHDRQVQVFGDFEVQVVVGGVDVGKDTQLKRMISEAGEANACRIRIDFGMCRSRRL